MLKAVSKVLVVSVSQYLQTREPAQEELRLVQRTRLAKPSVFQVEFDLLGGEKMSTQDYQKSISTELKSIQNRVRDLIGNANWGDEGRYKEAALRFVIRRMLPLNISIGTGFIITPEQVSSQIDIILWDNSFPIAFKDGDFVIVPPICVRGIIEVKTRLSSGNIAISFEKASENGKFLDQDTFNGIFAYESDLVIDRNISNKLHSVLECSIGNVNHLSLGENIFVKFWDKKYVFSSDSSPVVNEYSVYKIPGLSFPYFLSNLISDISKEKGDTLSWFLYPIEEGKESYKISSIQARNLSA